MVKELYTAIKAEMLKCKRTYALALVVLAPLFISGMMTTIFFFKAERLVSPNSNGIVTFLDGSINASASMLFPFYLILLTILIHQLEHRAHSLKDLFSYPVSYFSTYTSKWIVVSILIGVSIVLYVLFSFLGIWLISIKHPSLMHYNANAFLFFVKQVGAVTLASMLLLAIQFLIALRWSNAIVAFGVGVVGFMSSIILVQGWEYVHFHPYALGLLTYMKSIGKGEISLTYYLLYSSIGAVVMYIGGYFMWCKRRIV